MLNRSLRQPVVRISARVQLCSFDDLRSHYAQNKSSGNSKVKTIIAVLLGVLGLGAIAAAIVQFAGPALKAFGINLPGL